MINQIVLYAEEKKAIKRSYQKIQEEEEEEEDDDYRGHYSPRDSDASTPLLVSTPRLSCATDMSNIMKVHICMFTSRCQACHLSLADRFPTSQSVTWQWLLTNEIYFWHCDMGEV